jgi:hypothetical protein
MTTYIVEFKTAEDEALAISIPRGEARVIKHFQERMPYARSCQTLREEPSRLSSVRPVCRCVRTCADRGLPRPSGPLREHRTPPSKPSSKKWRAAGSDAAWPRTKRRSGRGHHLRALPPSSPAGVPTCLPQRLLLGCSLLLLRCSLVLLRRSLLLRCSLLLRRSELLWAAVW